MRHGSLFSGVGGFDLSAEWMGWENVFHCEINPFGKKVLKYYWPKAISYDDITKTDFTIHRGGIDILSGGFPCQPFSVAGKRKGTEDSRNLWPEYYRAIREIQPVWVVGENVPGLINWSEGLVFEQVQADLETEGYEVWPVILSACSAGAPHLRNRIWFIAYRTNSRIKSVRTEKIEFNGFRTSTDTKSTGLERKDEPECCQGRERMQVRRNTTGHGSSNVVTNTNSGRQSSEEHGQKESGRIAKESIPTDWRNFPTQSPVCSRNDGISSRLDGITFPKWRNESIKAAGNAIVPQVVYQIFKAIEKYERASLNP